MNTFSNDTVEFLRQEVELSERSATAARETQERQQRAADRAQADAEWHERRVVELKALLEYIGFINVPDVVTPEEADTAPHDSADCGPCADAADSARDADQADRLIGRGQ